MVKKRKLDYSIIWAIIFIILIGSILVFATMIKLNEQGTTAKPNGDGVPTQSELETAKNDALKYIRLLEQKYQQNITDNSNAEIPSGTYITVVDTTLGIGVYPTNINLFVIGGRVQSGIVEISGYTLEYQNGTMNVIG